MSTKSTVNFIHFCHCKPESVICLRQPAPLHPDLAALYRFRSYIDGRDHLLFRFPLLGRNNGPILAAMKLAPEKIRQACSLLKELGIDLWLMTARETAIASDPMLSMVVGHDATWQSFFFYTGQGDAIALVGNLDVEDYRRCGWFTEVFTYTEGVSADFRKIVERLDPARIALNFSQSDASADGLTYGMYLNIREYLKDTKYADRLVSAEDICSKLRARKLRAESNLVADAAVLAEHAFRSVLPKIRTGMTEIEIGRLIDTGIAGLGSANSFPTLVNAGDKTSPGHGLPTKARLEPGDLLHVDFGAVVEGYCSDIQRVVYFRSSDEQKPPAKLVEAFDLVRDIITETAVLTRPGARGFEIDRAARQRLTEHGYPEYQHALGHQLGRAVHDGGAILGPKWERYGRTPETELEAGNIFTLELEINLPGIGCVGLEEDVLIDTAETVFLCPRQLELTVV